MSTGVDLINSIKLQVLQLTQENTELRRTLDVMARRINELSFENEQYRMQQEQAQGGSDGSTGGSQ